MKLITAIAVIPVLLAGTGCSLPNQVTMAPDLKLASHTATVPVPRKAVGRLPGELDNGSASHALSVNGVQLVLTYFTPEDAMSWGPESQGAVNVSAQVQGVETKRIARITRFKLVAPPYGSVGEDTVLVNDTGQFVIGAPYSYGSAFTFPKYPRGTKQVKIRVYVDLEIETRPRSGQYTRQSLIDILRVSTVPAPLDQRESSKKERP